MSGMNIGTILNIQRRLQLKRPVLYTREEVEEELECAVWDLELLEDDREEWMGKGIEEVYEELLEENKRKIEILKATIRFFG